MTGGLALWASALVVELWRSGSIGEESMGGWGRPGGEAGTKPQLKLELGESERCKGGWGWRPWLGC